MSDRMVTNYDREAEAKAKCLFEAREALKSIVGAIQGAGDLDELGMEQLRVVAEEVEKMLGFIKEQLEGQDDG